MMKIRVASPNDARSISNIHTESWRNTYQNVLSAKYLSDVVPRERQNVWVEKLQSPKANQHVLVAEVGKEIIGFACLYAKDNPTWGAFLDSLHIVKAHRSKGVGKALLAKAMAWCTIEAPGEGLCLLVNQDNKRAQQFYQSFGAKNAGTDIWNAPDGSIVPTYWFIWDGAELQKNYGE